MGNGFLAITVKADAAREDSKLLEFSLMNVQRRSGVFGYFFLKDCKRTTGILWSDAKPSLETETIVFFTVSQAMDECLFWNSH